MQMFCYGITKTSIFAYYKNNTNMISDGNKPELPKTPVSRSSERQERAIKIFSRITENKQTNTKQGNSENKGKQGKK